MFVFFIFFLKNKKRNVCNSFFRLSSPELDGTVKCAALTWREESEEGAGGGGGAASYSASFLPLPVTSWL